MQMFSTEVEYSVVALVALPSLASVGGRVVREEGIHAKTESHKQFMQYTIRKWYCVDFPFAANYDQSI